MRTWTVLQQHINTLHCKQTNSSWHRLELTWGVLSYSCCLLSSCFFYPFKLLMSGHCYKMIQALNAKTFSNCSIMGYHNRCAKATELTCTDNLNFNIFLLIRTQVGKLQVLLTSFSYLCNYILYASLRFWDLIKKTIKEYICIYSWQFWFQPVMFKYHLKFVYKDFFFSVLRNISF